MKILFTVCGRAGSKGIKNKNIRKFLGNPLPYYTLSAIELYMKRNRTDDIDVALSTDSNELIDIVNNNPFVSIEIVERNAELSGDRVAKQDVIADCMKQLEKRRGVKYDMVVDLDLTSPLRTVDDIANLIETQKKMKADVTYSVTTARRNPYFNMVRRCEKGVECVIQNTYASRQEAPEVFDMNASLYAYDAKALVEKDVFNGYCEIIIMEDTAVLDLDHENDFELMQLIAKYLYDNKIKFAEVYQNIMNRTLETNC